MSTIGRNASVQTFVRRQGTVEKKAIEWSSAVANRHRPWSTSEWVSDFSWRFDDNKFQFVTSVFVNSHFRVLRRTGWSIGSWIDGLHLNDRNTLLNVWLTCARLDRMWRTWLTARLGLTNQQLPTRTRVACRHLLPKYHVIAPLTLWRPLLPYGYSYKASCARRWPVSEIFNVACNAVVDRWRDLDTTSKQRSMSFIFGTNQFLIYDFPKFP